MSEVLHDRPVLLVPEDPISPARDESVVVPKQPPTEPPKASATPSEPQPAAALWLRRADQLFVGTLVLALLILLGVHWVRLSRWGTEPIEIVRHSTHKFEYQLDINSATWVEWIQLDGIGEVMARRIVADREENGPFRSVDDLTRVKGIGPKTVEKLRPWVRVVPTDESDR